MSQMILWLCWVGATTGGASGSATGETTGTHTEGVVPASGSVVVVDGSVVTASGIRHRHQVAPLCPPTVPVYPDCPPFVPGAPGMPPTIPPDVTVPPGAMPPDLSGLTSPFATQIGAGGLQGRAFNEAFDGDSLGVYYRKNVSSTTFVRQQIGTRQETRTVIDPNGTPTTIVVTVPVFGNVPVTTTRGVLVPVPGRYSGISITDNDSPRPTDRLYFNYSYYDGIGAGLAPGLGNITMNRPVLGFEKTFLGGDASIGMRLPFVQLNGPPGIGGDSVGDLSILGKYAFINNPNGDVFSAGMILTTPTAARGGFLSDGTLVPHSVLFQPWVGFVTGFDRAYVQGVSAVIVPTDSRDTTLMSNSLGVGYWLYRSNADRFITGIIPVAEVHIRTPFTNRDINGLVYLQDQVNITGGLHLRLPRAVIGGAVSVPVVGPRPWNIEAIANCAFRF